MRLLSAACLSLLALGCTPATNPTVPPAAVSPSNSAAPSAGTTSTAPVDATFNNPRDTKITNDIRAKINGIDTLSEGARTVQIITAGGKVSLRGDVASWDEKNKVDALAAEVVGKDNVTSDLIAKE